MDWANEDVHPYRRKTMSRIRSKNTKPERLFRKALWNMGVRYRLHGKKMPGNPDIFIKKYRLAIFIDGEFWHGYDWENNKEKLQTRKAFWTQKIENNIRRDEKANFQLKQMGYEVMRFWANDAVKNTGACVRQVLNYIDNFIEPNIALKQMEM